MISRGKALVKGVMKSRDGRRLAGNSSYLMLMQLGNYVFPLVTIPYLARVIGVEGIGKIAFAASVIMWFQTISDWGFNYTATRDVARCKDDLAKVSRIFSDVFWTRVTLMAVSFVILLLAIAAVPYLQENRAILLATFLLIPGHILLSEWVFQAMEKMKFITIFSFASKAIFTALVFIFINDEADYVLHPIFMSIGTILMGAVVMYVIFRQWGVRLAWPRWDGITYSIRNSSDVFMNNMLPNLYNSFGVVLLGFWGGAAANGIFDAGRKFVGVAHSLLSVFIRATFPYFSRDITKHGLFAKIYLSVAALGTVVTFVAAPVLIDIFYTGEFAAAVNILRICSFSIFLVAVSRLYGTNYLIVRGHERPLRNVTLVCSLIGLSISIPLIYTYSYFGTAVALVSTQTLLAVSIALKARSVRQASEAR